ncbi:transposase [Parachlamydia acanthamoebae UV-7]|uniref:Transposase n=2 Tax=Parachlamydia acanthamoebae TaxID=83552 RepID=F8KVB2_PARAV|nr:hypothetical protein [Parachlamydia acanthamoebae]CCB87634.1 transposase [Parachlamydia acanthamoebae UV-7]
MNGLVSPIPVRKSLSADALISIVYHEFQLIHDPKQFTTKKPASISFTDVLMSGLSVFGLKFPSLLQYDQQRKILDDNLKALYHVKHFPFDTYLRERLDELEPKHIRPIFKKIFTEVQRGKCLEEFEFLDGHYLLALDATGEFSSNAICCAQCCKKEHQNGPVTYYHQMLGACIVHPDKSTVIPLCPEVIQNEDGSIKNDCERNATKRFIENFRREHPHLKAIILGYGINSNAPYIRILEENNLKYILVAKPGDHQFLFEAIEKSDNEQYYEVRDDKGFLHQFRFVNGVALNKSNPNVRVNFVEYMQTDPKGKELRFSWVTNICITSENVFVLMRGGRARWKIENETFNTLKNLEYNFEHNYGHGKKYISTNLCLLMMIAFLIDQVQAIACRLFQTIRKRLGDFRVLCETIRVLIQYMTFESWEDLYRRIAVRYQLNIS